MFGLKLEVQLGETFVHLDLQEGKRCAPHARSSAALLMSVARVKEESLSWVSNAYLEV